MTKKGFKLDQNVINGAQKAFERGGASAMYQHMANNSNNIRV